MFEIINSPIVLIMIFVISLFVGNHIYQMGLKRGVERGRKEGIDTGRLQILEENMIRNKYIEERQVEHFSSLLRLPQRKELI